MATSYETRLVELIDRLQEALDELRQHVKAGGESALKRDEALRAFADEALRDRDA